MEQHRASSLFQPPNLNAAIGADGNYGEHDEGPKQLFGAALMVSHREMARIVAPLGFDFIFIDTLFV